MRNDSTIQPKQPPPNALLVENCRLRNALHAVRLEIQQANDADVALFMRLGLDESEKWDQPSRNLQTFSYVLQEIDAALNPKP